VESGKRSARGVLEVKVRLGLEYDNRFGLTSSEKEVVVMI
jgi:hypothetical protein